MAVVKGFNSDVSYQGHSYHVQTEDWGRAKSSVVTKVFKNGAVVKTFTSSYEDLMKENLNQNSQEAFSQDDSPVDHPKEEHIQWAMQWQHRKIITLLHSGHL